LEAPAAHAAVVLAFDGDEIDQAVKAHPAGLTPVRRFTLAGQPAGTMYISGTPAAMDLPLKRGAVVASGKEAR
jgi:hypothetical protein